MAFVGKVAIEGPNKQGKYDVYHGLFHCEMCRRNGCQVLRVNRHREDGWYPEDEEIARGIMDMVRKNHDCLAPPITMNEILGHA